MTCNFALPPMLLLLPSSLVSQAGSLTWCLLIILPFQNRTLSTSLLFYHQWQGHYPYCHSDSVTQGYFFTLTFLMLHAFWPGPYPTPFYFWYCSDPFFSFDPSVKFLTQNFLPLFLTFIILFFFLFVFKTNVASLKANCSQWIPSFSLLAFSYPFLFYILKASCLKFEILTKLYMRAF